MTAHAKCKSDGGMETLRTLKTPTIDVVYRAAITDARGTSG
jgi:hypothetical protein